MKAKTLYGHHAKEATEELDKFVREHHSGAVLVTYFDEADELDTLFWVLLRLLGSQDECTRMWYIFLATKSSVNLFNPIAENSEFSVLSFAYMPQPRTVLSLRLKDELKRLLPPYIALDFDQNMTAESQEPHCVTVEELQTLRHLARYGRPLCVVSVFMNTVAHRVLDGMRSSTRNKNFSWSIQRV